MNESKKYWEEKHKNSVYTTSEWSNKNTIFSEQAVSYFPEIGRVLDIGTGQGRDAGYFKNLGYDVVATDLSAEAIDRAKEKYKDIDFMVLNTDQGLPFDDESFDVVYSHMALHYFDEEKTKKVFNDIYRILKPGGILATLTNTIKDPEIQKYNYKKMEEGFYFDPRGKIEKRYFSPESLEFFTKDLFKTIILDNEGLSYKDGDLRLVRFIGRKK